MELLKGTIGFVIDTKAPWEAQSPVYSITTANVTFGHILRALHLKRNKLTKFKIICVLDTGQQIWAPKIKQIQTQNTEFGHCCRITWILPDIKTSQNIEICSLKLIDDLGLLIIEYQLGGPIQGHLNDIIKLGKIDITAS